MKYKVMIMFLLSITKFSSAEVESCEKEFRKYVKEISYRSSPTICKNNTMLLEIELKQAHNKGDNRLSAIGVFINDRDRETITNYNLRLPSSKHRSSTYTCINKKYVENSKVEFYFSKKETIFSKENGHNITKHISKSSSEICPLNSLI